MGRWGSLRVWLLGALVLLQVQFLIGMAVNLFVKVPTDHPGARAPEYFGGVVQSVYWAITQGPFWLLVHASFGLLLVVLAFVTFVRALALRRRGPIIATLLGGLAVLAAGFNGGSYLNYNEDFSSMLMAAGFALAVAIYSVALYVAP